MKLLKCLPLLLSLCCAYAEPLTEKQFKNLRTLAEQGKEPLVQCFVGLCYEKGNGVRQNKAEAVKWYRKAAEQGDAEAQVILGNCYESGNGVPQEYAEAVKWYRKAAEQGFAEAQFNLGASYTNGNGVPQDNAEAVKWYRKAAEQGFAQAQHRLGVCYANGKGVPKNDITAYMWYNLSQAQGNDDSKKLKDLIIQRMTKEQIAEAQKLSREWLEKREKVE